MRSSECVDEGLSPCLSFVKPLSRGDFLHTWKIIRKIGEGGFGAVYEVQDEVGRTYALKTECVEATNRTLKMEVVVLKALKHLDRLKHFCEIVDSGRDLSYNYVVMTLIGKTLNDLRKARGIKNEPGRLTQGCAISVGMDCLEAIKELHDTGFLHRDIKPANFAIGQDQPRRVILFDFGLCRRYVDQNKNIRTPRWATGFRGTLRYASISVHISREMCPKDDLESWFYQLVELTTGNLPWSQEDDMDKTVSMKERAREEGQEEFLKDCPDEYLKILLYVDQLRYYDTPNYDALQKAMQNTLATTGTQRYPYDWEDSSNFTRSR